jgi:hypothetical protein
MIAVCAAVAAPAPAIGSEGSEDAARDAFEEGTRFFQYLHYAEALDAFKRAYALRPSYKILYNVAQSQAMLGHHDLALDAFEEYLAQGGDLVQPDRRRSVERDIAQLMSKVGAVEVEGPRGAEVWIDGERKGHLPLAAALSMSQGDHLVTIRRPPTASCDVPVEIVGGATTSVACEPIERRVLEGPPSPGKKTGAAEKPERRTGRRGGGPMPKEKVVAWTAAGLGAGSLVAAVVCAWKTTKLNATLDGACEGGACPPSHADEVDALPRYAGAADGLFVATAVLGAVAVAFFVAPWRREEPVEPAGAAGLAALAPGSVGGAP